MSKKLIVSFVALTMVIVAVFAACNNPDVYVDPAGNTNIAVTNEEGNTVLNEDGDILVYQTEADGKIVTDADGVAQTLASFFPEKLVSGNTVLTPTYTVQLPSGWKADETLNGVYLNNSCDSKIEIQVQKVLSFADFKKQTEDNFDALVAAAKKDNPDLTITTEFKDFQYLAASTTAYVWRIYAVNPETKVAQYIDYMYFTVHQNVYSIRLTTTSTAGHEKVDFPAFYSAIQFKPYRYYSDKELAELTTAAPETTK